jgi:hypothetical protein
MSREAAPLAEGAAEGKGRGEDSVIPAKAGTSGRPAVPILAEVPASAGMTCPTAPFSP